MSDDDTKWETGPDWLTTPSGLFLPPSMLPPVGHKLLVPQGTIETFVTRIPEHSIVFVCGDGTNLTDSQLFKVIEGIEQRKSICVLVDSREDIERWLSADVAIIPTEGYDGRVTKVTVIPKTTLQRMRQKLAAQAKHITALIETIKGYKKRLGLDGPESSG